MLALLVIIMCVAESVALSCSSSILHAINMKIHECVAHGGFFAFFIQIAQFLRYVIFFYRATDTRYQFI